MYFYYGPVRLLETVMAPFHRGFMYLRMRGYNMTTLSRGSDLVILHILVDDIPRTLHICIYNEFYLAKIQMVSV